MGASPKNSTSLRKRNLDRLTENAERSKSFHNPKAKTKGKVKKTKVSYTDTKSGGQIHRRVKPLGFQEYGFLATLKKWRKKAVERIDLALGRGSCSIWSFFFDTYYK